LSKAIAGYWPYWLVLMYLPALVMVLLRPNVPGDGVWADPDAPAAVPGSGGHEDQPDPGEPSKEPRSHLG
jgi:hypothetical protein